MSDALILVVVDDTEVRALAVAVVEAAGYQAIAVENGATVALMTGDPTGVGAGSRAFSGTTRAARGRRLLAPRRRPSSPAGGRWRRGRPAGAALMIPAAIEFGGRYGGLAMPVAIMAGTDDEIVDLARQSRRLHEELPRSALRLVPGGGHMMHHLGAPGRRTRRSGRKPLGNEAGPTTSGRGVTGG